MAVPADIVQLASTEPLGSLPGFNVFEAVLYLIIAPSPWRSALVRTPDRQTCLIAHRNLTLMSDSPAALSTNFYCHYFFYFSGCWV